MADTTKVLTEKRAKLASEKVKAESALKTSMTNYQKLVELHTPAKHFVDKEFFGSAVEIGKKTEKYFGKKVMSLEEAKKALAKIETDLKKAKETHDSATNKLADINKEYKEITVKLEAYVDGKAKLDPKDPNYGKDKKQLKAALGL
jgi:hypothetical protein